MPAPDLRTTALRAVDRLPLFSAVLHRALTLFSAGDDVSIGALAETIEQDVVIAGNVLSIANSALYGRYTAVASVRAAVARLGIHKTRNALLGLSVARTFRAVRVPGHWSSAQFNAHSLATATISDLLVLRKPTLWKPAANSEWAFTAGLLHDVGLLLIAAGLPDQFMTLQENAKADFQLVEHERELLGFTHYDVGADLLAAWNCPHSVQEAIRFCDRNAFEFQSPSSLGAAVKTASILADANGIRIFPSNQPHTSMMDFLKALEIGDPAEFCSDFDSEFGGLQACAA